MTVDKADKGKEDRQGKVGARIGSGEMKNKGGVIFLILVIDLMAPCVACLF